MSEIGEGLISTAKLRIGSAFSEHFKPEDICLRGEVTLPDCMEKGLGPRSYDCSGLLISCTLELLDEPIDKWPMDYRHATQLGNVAKDQEPEPGDALIYYPSLRSHRMHAGIYVAEGRIIHASGKLGWVTEGKVTGNFSKIKSISSAVLSNLVKPN